MLRRTPLKPKAKRNSAAMKRFHDWVARQGCVVCGREATIHHVTSTINGPIPLEAGPRRDDRRVAPLCPSHHQTVFDPIAADPISVEGMNHQQFHSRYGIDLFAVANDLWTQWEAA